MMPYVLMPDVILNYSVMSANGLIVDQFIRSSQCVDIYALRTD